MKPPVAALVALGSALGAGLRWTLSLLLAGGGHGPPWPILLVNALGALAAGIYAGRHGPQGRRPHDLRLQAFVLPGLCAGFTTFSIFSLDALHWGWRGASGRPPSWCWRAWPPGCWRWLPATGSAAASERQAGNRPPAAAA